MRGINLAIVMGYVGADPTVRQTQGGTKVARMRVATNRAFRPRGSEEWREVAEWHRIVAFGALAEVVEERVAKGDPVCVQGRMNTRQWKDRNAIDRWTTEVVAEEVHLMRVRASDGEGAPEEEPEPEQFDDDLPF